MASFTVLADDNDEVPIIYEDVDIAPLVKYFSKDVRVLSKESKVFHWDYSGRSGTGELMLDYIRSMANLFWNKYGDFSEGSYHGDGLYLAMDPIHTNQYSNGEKTWSLLVLNLPKKLKVLDLSNAKVRIDFDSTDTALLPIVKILNSFNCNPFSTVEDLFYSSLGPAQPLECRNLIKKIFKDILGVQLISYAYGRATNYSCENVTISNYLAFILTDSKWVKKGMFQFYNRDYVMNEDERTEIQSLYLYKVNGSLKQDSEIKNEIKNYLLQHLDMNFEKSTSECEGINCVLKAEFCNTEKNKCESISLKNYVKLNESKITSEAAKRMVNSIILVDGSYLLWPDLEGKPRSKNTSQWVKDNIFGCSGEFPYEPQNP